MMLMSWGGEPPKAAVSLSTEDLAVEVQRSSRAILQRGVDHGNEHPRNFLWNEERRCVMLIDFAHYIAQVKC